MFTLAISYLTTSNLPWFMDLTFQVPMQYSSLQHQTLLLSPFSRGISNPKDRTQVSCIAGRFFTVWATREPHVKRSIGSRGFLLYHWLQRILRHSIGPNGLRERPPAGTHLDHTRSMLDQDSVSWVVSLYRNGNITPTGHCLFSLAFVMRLGTFLYLDIPSLLSNYLIKTPPTAICWVPKQVIVLGHHTYTLGFNWAYLCTLNWKRSKWTAQLYNLLNNHVLLLAESWSELITY